MVSRRRVDDQQIVVLLRRRFENALHGYEFPGPSERGGELAVVLVRKNGIPDLTAGGVLIHQPVEGLFGIEHHGRQPAGRFYFNLRRFVTQSLQTHGLSQPMGRIDGHHQCRSAPLRGQHSKRSARRGLADTAAAAADDDPPIRDDAFQLERGTHGALPIRGIR